MSDLRCMTCLSATGPLGDWQAALPEYMPGNRMDTINSLYVVLPPAETLAQLPPEDVITLPADSPLSEQITLVGSTLAQSPNNKILIGTAAQWRQLYNTPYWRLWCAPFIYESDADTQYQADLSALGMASTLTRTAAHQAIKSMVSA